MISAIYPHTERALRKAAIKVPRRQGKDNPAHCVWMDTRPYPPAQVLVRREFIRLAREQNPKVLGAKRRGSTLTKALSGEIEIRTNLSGARQQPPPPAATAQAGQAAATANGGDGEAAEAAFHLQKNMSTVFQTMMAELANLRVSVEKAEEARKAETAARAEEFTAFTQKVEAGIEGRFDSMLFKLQAGVAQGLAEKGGGSKAQTQKAQNQNGLIDLLGRSGAEGRGVETMANPNPARGLPPLGPGGLAAGATAARLPVEPHRFLPSKPEAGPTKVETPAPDAKAAAGEAGPEGGTRGKAAEEQPQAEAVVPEGEAYVMRVAASGWGPGRGPGRT